MKGKRGKEEKRGREMKRRNNPPPLDALDFEFASASFLIILSRR